MKRIMLNCKIHRATVTHAEIDYEGSIAIDSTLMRAAGLLPYQKVEIYNITNGNRFQTYTIVGEENSGTIGINGAAAHLAKPGDLVIIAGYGEYNEEEALKHEPTLVYVDEKNKIKDIKNDIVQVA